MELETNLIYCGDNKEVLAKFPEKSVDLIYADPPFFSNKHYEIIWGNGAEMKVYEDRWKGGINVYIEWMKERLWQCYRVLKDSGAMYLHCDWHASHRLRVAMDDIFGEHCFRNDIVWCYKAREFSKKYWNRKHDDILFYTKSQSYTFNWDVDGVIEPLSPVTKRKYCYEDEKGYYRLCGRGIKGSPIKSAKDVDPKWEETRPELVVRNYLAKGYAPSDYWNIPIINQMAKERLGYPTQKPEALLKRIILASSNAGGIVLDPFCGCGTTLVVAHQFGRKWIGIDISPIACDLMKARLNKIGVSDARIIGAPATTKELKSMEPFQFQNWVINRIGGVSSKKKSRDMGIDGYTFMIREPVQVKQSEGVGRNVVDNFETAIRREHKTAGYIVAFSFAKSTYEEAARVKLEENLDIKLVRVDEMDNYFG